MSVEEYPNVRLLPGTKCQHKGCRRKATTIACGRSGWGMRGQYYPVPGVYCDSHAAAVSDEGSPEYINICPNCGCMHGVN